MTGRGVRGLGGQRVGGIGEYTYSYVQYGLSPLKHGIPTYYLQRKLEKSHRSAIVIIPPLSLCREIQEFRKYGSILYSRPA